MNVEMDVRIALEALASLISTLSDKRENKNEENEIAALILIENEIAAPKLTENEIAAPILTENEIAAPILTENETAAPKLTENEIAAPKLTENETVAPKLTENEKTQLAAKQNLSAALDAEIPLEQYRKLLQQGRTSEFVQIKGEPKLLQISNTLKNDLIKGNLPQHSEIKENTSSIDPYSAQKGPFLKNLEQQLSEAHVTELRTNGFIKTPVPLETAQGIHSYMIGINPKSGMPVMTKTESIYCPDELEISKGIKVAPNKDLIRNGLTDTHVFDYTNKNGNVVSVEKNINFCPQTQKLIVSDPVAYTPFVTINDTITNKYYTIQCGEDIKKSIVINDFLQNAELKNLKIGDTALGTYIKNIQKDNPTQGVTIQCSNARTHELTSSTNKVVMHKAKSENANFKLYDEPYFEATVNKWKNKSQNDFLAQTKSSNTLSNEIKTPVIKKGHTPKPPKQTQSHAQKLSR